MGLLRHATTAELFSWTVTFLPKPIKWTFTEPSPSHVQHVTNLVSSLPDWWTPTPGLLLRTLKMPCHCTWKDFAIHNSETRTLFKNIDLYLLNLMASQYSDGSGCLISAFCFLLSESFAFACLPPRPLVWLASSTESQICIWAGLQTLAQQWQGSRSCSAAPGDSGLRRPDAEHSVPQQHLDFRLFLLLCWVPLHCSHTLYLTSTSPILFCSSQYTCILTFYMWKLSLRVMAFLTWVRRLGRDRDKPHAQGHIRDD